MAKRRDTEIKKPGIVDGVLVLVLIIWIITVFVMLNKMLPLNDFQLGLSAITAFSALFCSIIVIIIAIILENIRRELQ